MAGLDGQKAPKTSGKISRLLTSGLVNLSTTCDYNAFVNRLPDDGIYSFLRCTHAFGHVFCQVRIKN